MADLCRSCDAEIAEGALRWRCPVCGFLVHYAHVAGGVPVAATPVCPDCGANLRAIEGTPGPAEDQGDLFA